MPVLDISQDELPTTKNVWKWNRLLQGEVISIVTRVVKVENGKKTNKQKNAFHCGGGFLWVGVDDWKMSPRLESLGV